MTIYICTKCGRIERDGKFVYKDSTIIQLVAKGYTNVDTTICPDCGKEKKDG